MIRLRDDEAESIVAFVKMHERDEIPDDVWDADKADRILNMANEIYFELFGEEGVKNG